MPVKVSIVVPTYAPGDRIDGLVRSIEAQTMPASEFEVIFVDDGSPDDTWQQLERIRDSHDNVRIEHIENSGWPSRPRNVGLELATGEYVLFMDHDDEIYPRALEAGYDFAARNHADVLNGKEARTDQSKWALQVFTANMDNSIDREDCHPLLQTNPHKLFRRELLMDHDIRFPEGGRVLWEDVFFNLDVARHAKVISVLSDVPFYHWVRGKTTASSSYTTDLREYWRWVREIVIQTNAKLGGPGFERQWTLMMRHQYVSRVLAPVGPALFEKTAEEQEHVRAIAEEIVDEHIPVELDAILTPTQLARAVLLRAKQWDVLERFVQVDRGVVGLTQTTSVQWRDGVLHIKGESRWHADQSAELRLRVENGRILRDFPSDVAAALPTGAVDVTDALAQAATGIAIRSRASAVVWLLPSQFQTRVDTIGDIPELVVTVAATLDPTSAAHGEFLAESAWDFHARNELFGATNMRGLRTTTPARVSIQGGHVLIAYKNKSGMLSLDIDEKNRSLVGSAKLDPKRGTSSAERAGGSRWSLGKRAHAATFALPFTGVSEWDDTVFVGKARVGAGPSMPARVVPRADGPWLESRIEQRPGRYPLYLQFHDREVDSGLDVTVATNGDVTFARRS